MGDRVISIKKTNYQGNENDYYEIEYIENGVEYKKKLKYDEVGFKEYVEDYEKYLWSERNRCQNILKPYEFIRSLKLPTAVTYGVVFAIGVIILLFHKDGFAPLRFFVLGSVSVGLGGSGLFLHLENKFKNEKTLQTLEWVKFELKKISNLKSKNMVGTQRKKYFEQKEKESREKQFNEQKEYMFNPDRPNFLKHNGYEDDNTVKTSTKISKFSDVPGYLKKRTDAIYSQPLVINKSRELEGFPTNHIGEKTNQENNSVVRKTSSSETTRFNSNVKRQPNPNHNPDRPSFKFEREYNDGYGVSQESDVPEHLKRR